MVSDLWKLCQQWNSLWWRKNWSEWKSVKERNVITLGHRISLITGLPFFSVFFFLFTKFTCWKWGATYNRDATYFQDSCRIDSQTCNCIRSIYEGFCSGVSSSSRGNNWNEIMADCQSELGAATYNQVWPIIGDIRYCFIQGISRDNPPMDSMAT